MDLSPYEHWVLLRVEEKFGRLWVSYRDDSGARLEPPDEPGEFTPGWEDADYYLLGMSLEEYQAARIMLPADFDQLVNAAISRLPLLRSGFDKQIPLAFFYQVPQNLPYPGDVLVRALISRRSAIPEAQVHIVRLARRRWKRRPPFNLPLNLLAVDDAAAGALQELQNQNWYKENESIQRYGFRIRRVERQEMKAVLRSSVQDVLILADFGSVFNALRACKAIPNPSVNRPRLMIYLGGKSDADWAASYGLPPGMSLLQIAQENAAEILNEFFLGIVHDFPLHEALHAALGNSFSFNPPALLVSDPECIHDLHLSAAAEGLVDEVRAMDKEIDAGDVDTFLGRLPHGISASIREPMFLAAAQLPEIKQAVQDGYQLQYDFQRESRGLAPLALMRARATSALAARGTLRTNLLEITREPRLVDWMRRNQERRVDAALEAWDGNFYRPASPNQALQPGGRCRLRVHIGHPGQDSLMVGDIPPLDPLLPDPEDQQGHTLEVVVFEKDFGLLSARLQYLYLPLLGGSKPVFFELQVPDKNNFNAQLRLEIYHKNHLLQSFLMEAHVIEGPSMPANQQQIAMHLDFSRSARFTNLDELPERALALGANQDVESGTHSILIKKDDQAAKPVQLSQELIDKAMTDFRKMLEEATWDGNAPRFSSHPAAGKPPSPEFERCVRDLAAFGNKIYQAIFTSVSREMKARLRELRDSSDQTIQIIRHDPNFAFPWSVMYDYPLPRTPSGVSSAPICLGEPFSSGSSSPPGRLPKGCPHNPGQEVYCIEGFWGVRQRLEQFLPTGPAFEDAQDFAIPRPSPPVGVCLGLGIQDVPSQALAQELRSLLQGVLKEIQPQDDFYDLLWDEATRPALTILLSHLQEKDSPGEPHGARMLLIPKEAWKQPEPIPPDKWLRAKDITYREEYLGSWDNQPRPVILLMACSSGATEMASFNDFVKSLNSAGSAAIVGTECSIFSALGARFIRQVALELWRGSLSLGAAVQAFNRQLFKDGNPLAFAFTYLGNADLTITPKL